MVGMVGFVTHIRDRYTIVDEESRKWWRSRSSITTPPCALPLTDGTSYYSPPFFLTTQPLPVTEAFKIKNGKSDSSK
jgi:hypothetical protein